MRVGLISFHSFLRPGGVKRHILSLNKEFKKRGVYSKIIAPRRSLNENYGKDVILLGTSFPLSIWGTETDFCVNFNELAIKKTLEKEKFDILHFHNLGFPSTLQILRNSSSTNILTFHANLDGSKLLKRVPQLKYFLNKTVQWKIDGVIGVAPLNLKVFTDFKGPKAIIPNGIDLEEFNPGILRIKKFCDEKLNILFLGRLEERKGLIYLLKAYEILAKKYDNLRLIIVGSGELEKECQDWVEKHQLKEVYFEGEKPEQEAPKYFATADIFVSPAIFGESFGLVLIEAMATGKPIVGFANQGYKEFLKNKKGESFLVKPKNYMALTQKIESLVKSKALREKMGDWGINEAKKYSWSKIANQVLDFYKKCR